LVAWKRWRSWPVVASRSLLPGTVVPTLANETAEKTEKTLKRRRRWGQRKREGRSEGERERSEYPMGLSIRPSLSLPRSLAPSLPAASFRRLFRLFGGFIRPHAHHPSTPARPRSSGKSGFFSGSPSQRESARM